MGFINEFLAGKNHRQQTAVRILQRRNIIHDLDISMCFYIFTYHYCYFYYYSVVILLLLLVVVVVISLLLLSLLLLLSSSSLLLLLLCIIIIIFIHWIYSLFTTDLPLIHTHIYIYTHMYIYIYIHMYIYIYMYIYYIHHVFKQPLKSFFHLGRYATSVAPSSSAG